jgi:hypothetical protein
MWRFKTSGISALVSDSETAICGYCSDNPVSTHQDDRDVSPCRLAGDRQNSPWLGGSFGTCECTGSWITGAFVTCVYGDNASGTVHHLLIFFLTERCINLLWHGLTPPRRRRGESLRNHGENDGTAIVGPLGISLCVFVHVGCWESGKQIISTAGVGAVGITWLLMGLLALSYSWVRPCTTRHFPYLSRASLHYQSILSSSLLSCLYIIPWHWGGMSIVSPSFFLALTHYVL